MMQRKSGLLTLIGLAAILTTGSVAQAQTSQPLVRSGDLAYQGSFKLPTVSGQGFTYGGSAISYNAANDSLYAVGHVYDQAIAEVKIPALGGTATVLQPLKDPTGGKLGAIGGSGSLRIGGSLVFKNKLYVTGFVYYDGDASQRTTHFSRSTNLSDSAVTGPYSVGSLRRGFLLGLHGYHPGRMAEFVWRRRAHRELLSVHHQPHLVWPGAFGIQSGKHFADGAAAGVLHE